eukprot:984937-Prymnesium_polylepis.1
MARSLRRSGARGQFRERGARPSSPAPRWCTAVCSALCCVVCCGGCAVPGAVPWGARTDVLGAVVGEVCVALVQRAGCGGQRWERGRAWAGGRRKRFWSSNITGNFSFSRQSIVCIFRLALVHA